MEHSTEAIIIPAVYQDFNRHMCIAVKATQRHVYIIPMNAEGLELVELSSDRFLKKYTLSDCPVGRAAKRYLEFEARFGMPSSSIVKKLLSQILSAASGAPAAEKLNPSDAPTTKETEMVTAKKKATAKKPAAKQLAAKKPAAKQLAAKKPAAKQLAAKKPAATVKPTPEKKARKPGVTSLIMAELKKGAEKEEILMAIRDQFPDSKAGAAEISWCRSNLKKSGG